MGNVLLKKISTKRRIFKSKSNATIFKDKQGKLHCSKCGAFITK